MKTAFTSTFLLALLLINSTQAQPGKGRTKKPSNFSWGATYGQGNGGQAKFDSVNQRRSKNEVAIETTERRAKRGASTNGKYANQETNYRTNGKQANKTKLDDLKNPFDTNKVKLPAANSTGIQRRKINS